jgi:N-alpha-acetyltransferase 40
MSVLVGNTQADHDARTDRTGLGTLLLGFHSTVAYNMPFITKVMLTCFVSNEKALSFYRKLGFETDDISPGPRTLRGKTYQPDYAILSKAIRAVAEPLEDVPPT